MKLFEISDPDKKAARRQAQKDRLNSGSLELAALAKKIADEKMAKLYDGKPFKVSLPVKVANKTETREFTIDNLQSQRRALNKMKEYGLVDLGSVEKDAGDRQSKSSYAIAVPATVTMGASIPKHLHGLPAGTKRKRGYAPEDLRREAYE